MRRIGLGALALAALLIVVSLASLFLREKTRTIPTPVESEIELTLEHEGTTYKLHRGDVYKVGSDPGRLSFVETLYDPDFFAKNYIVVDGIPNKKDPDTGKLYPTRRHFEEGFEDALGVKELIGPERGWTSFTVQSPAAPSVPEYNALRQRIMTGQGSFLDNRIETSTEFVHTGKRSLKCTSLAPVSGYGHRQSIVDQFSHALHQG